MSETAQTLTPSGNVESHSPLTSEQQAAVDHALSMVKDDPGAMFEPVVLEALRALRDVPAQFARIRLEVKRAGTVPMTEFDKLTAVKGDGDSEEGDIFPEVEPWPEPVDGAQLLADLEEQFSLFVVADRETLRAASLWALFTWCHDSAAISPIAHISAPEKRCGKTVLLSCLQRTVSRPLPVSSISSSALFRSVEKWQPCLLVDEADSFMGDNEDLRGIINCGFNRDSAHVIRCAGDDHEPTRFNVFAPKVLCGIGKLADTIMDRAIPLRLRRKRPGEKSQRLRHSDPESWDNLRRRMARWSMDNEQRVFLSRPADIDGLNDRAQDAWEPLQQIATIAGGDWPDKTRHAAIALHGVEEESHSIGVELLCDIKVVFETEKADKLFSADLLNGLHADEEAPWFTWNKGKPMTLRQLGKRLGEYSIKSGTIRIGYRTAKGYRRDQFTDAFNRYLPSTPPSVSVTPSQLSKDAGSGDFSSVTQGEGVTDKKTLKPSGDAECDGVTLGIPPEEQESEWEAF